MRCAGVRGGRWPVWRRSSRAGPASETTPSRPRRLDVDTALRQLPAQFRAAVVLRDMCGLDYAEIADILDLPPGTVRSRIARAQQSGPSAGAGRERTVTPGPHLDEDRLSAVIDGEATAEDQQHVLACAGCGAKLEAWRTTLGRLTDPVPLPDATQRHVAVEAALAAAASANPAEPGAPGVAAGAGAVAEAAGSPPAGAAGSPAEAGSPPAVGVATPVSRRAPPAPRRPIAQAAGGSRRGGGACHRRRGRCRLPPGR